MTTFDTVVVDNASVDNSRELLARDYPWVRVIASPTNLGFAGGNNLALRQVSTPFAVLLNNDAVPQSGWLRNLLDTFRQPGRPQHRDSDREGRVRAEVRPYDLTDPRLSARQQ